MAGISQYQTVFRISKNAAGGNTQPRVNKRNRKQVSCISCRARKAKCDRQVPCMQCLKRGDEASCTYPSATKSELATGDGERTSEAQLRLRKLEDMVNSLVGNKHVSENCNGEEEEASRDSDRYQSVQQQAPGKMPEMEGAETSYLGATHWRAVLQNIRDIRVVLETEPPEETDEISSSLGPASPDILIDTTNPLTLSEVYKTLPPRHVADKLLALFFSTKYIQMPILHKLKFSREYELFWERSSPPSFLWISLLFSVLHIGSQVYKLSDSDGDDLETPTSEELMKISGRALVAGKYYQGKPYSVEATLMFAILGLCRQEDREMESWMIMGVVTRLSVKLGYHRDPRHLRGISPFEGEMRRRTFFVVEAMDLLLSFQAGLPPIMHERLCDTGPPSNIFDTDFDEDCQVLPPPRPATDPTPMLYCLCKRQQIKLLRRVSCHALSFKPPAYEETMQLDAELHDAHKNLPQCVRIQPLCSSFIESTQTVMIRLNIELLYLRSICVLHRRYLSSEKSDPTYNYSRKICTDAALQTLKYESELHRACEPGGRFHNEKWITSSLILYDFLLSAMLICLDLYESRNKVATASPADLESQVRKYDAIEQSHIIWTSRKGTFKDARHASEVLSIMLSKVTRPDITSILLPHSSICNRNSTIEPMESRRPNEPYIATVSQPPAQPLPDEALPPDSSSVDPLNAIFSESDPIDWELVDQFLFHRTATADSLADWQLSDTVFGI